MRFREIQRPLNAKQAQGGNGTSRVAKRLTRPLNRSSRAKSPWCARNFGVHSTKPDRVSGETRFGSTTAVTRCTRNGKERYVRLRDRRRGLCRLCPRGATLGGSGDQRPPARGRSAGRQPERSRAAR